MTNRIAIGLALFLAAGFGIGTLFVDDLGVVLARRFADLIEWLAFWR